MTTKANHGSLGVAVDGSRERADAKIGAPVNEGRIVRPVDLFNRDSDDVHEVMNNALKCENRLRVYEHLSVIEDPYGGVRVVEADDLSLVIDAHEKNASSRIGKGAEGASQARGDRRDRLELKDVALTTTQSTSEIRHGGL